MILFKKLSLILGISVYIAVALWLNLLLTVVDSSRRLRAISQWTRIINKFFKVIFRLKIVIEGERDRFNESGNFIVSNHLSYLDGVILGSLFAVVYVSKSQVKSWPVFGWMTQVGGTIFIDREKKHKTPEYIRQAARALKNKVNLLVFPEGTSTSGNRLLPFQTVHFESPLITSSPILPVTVRYTRIDGQEVTALNRDKVCWYGQVKMFRHLNRLLDSRSIEAKVTLHPKVKPVPQLPGYSTRKQISENLYKVISGDYPLFKETSKESC